MTKTIDISEETIGKFARLIGVDEWPAIKQFLEQFLETLAFDDRMEALLKSDDAKNIEQHRIIAREIMAEVAGDMGLKISWSV